MSRRFERSYWETHYFDLETIDGIGNVRDHSRYLAAFFNLEGFRPRSIVDLGFGTGHLMREVRRVFKPRSLEGIEPSEWAFQKVAHSKGARLYQEDLLTWCRTPARGVRVFDLALCTSVWQYLARPVLQEVIPLMAQRCRYLYLTVPTDVEYQRQKTELNFEDEWAYSRSRKFYQALIRPHFTVLSTRILESRVHYDEHNTPFQDLLFRY